MLQKELPLLSLVSVIICFGYNMNKTVLTKMFCNYLYNSYSYLPLYNFYKEPDTELFFRISGKALLTIIGCISAVLYSY